MVSDLDIGLTKLYQWYFCSQGMKLKVIKVIINCGIYRIISIVPPLSPNPPSRDLTESHTRGERKGTQIFFFKTLWYCSHIHSCGAKTSTCTYKSPEVKNTRAAMQNYCVKHCFFSQYDQGVRRSDSLF